MKIINKVVSCLYDDTIYDGSSDPIVNSLRGNDENSGYLAVTLSTTDNNTGRPEPRVTLADAQGEQIYGALVTLSPGSQRCGIVTSGIVPFRRNSGSAAGDIGNGIWGDSTVAGQVVPSNAPTKGRGIIVARDTNRVFVDLDMSGQNTTT